MKCILLFITAFALFGFAQGKGKGKGKGQGGGGSSVTSVSVSFGSGDRRVIQDWMRQAGPSGLPPGLAKRGQLPPGLEKQLARNGTLPPGLQKKLTPFPPELSRRLPPLPSGCACDRFFIEGRAMILGRGTNLILDVLAGF